VTRQIEGLQNALTQDRNQQVNIQEELKNIATHLDKISLSANKTNHELKHQNAILEQLHTKEESYQTQLMHQRDSLTHAIRAAYMLGQYPYLKLLLSQEGPNQMGRILIYYKYINAACLKTMSDLNSTIKDIKLTQQQIKMQKQKLQIIGQHENKQKNNLTITWQQRRQFLNHVKDSIHNKYQTLTTLIANKKALETLILSLKTVTVTFPQPKVPFSNLQGKLPWPVNGNIIQHFGRSIDGTHMAATGVIIAAPEGMPIRAVYPGRVVFAGWLRGLGLLIIIDHGHNYMTLYGDNRDLIKKTGDYVTAGTVIATSGPTSDANQSGLYFQLRDNGKPLNPELWCK
jgi:septal ring factor EnvC (AmiA/AmiB activator)